ncbi:hypothetical protein IKG60_01585 [Candidatus Saccharibacteria bacterium]|nr:hypothetical protein [Candidatus Saccharibacteria bacterium]
MLKQKFIKLCGSMLLAVATLLPVAGVQAKDINISTSDYGYGDYVVRVTGTGISGSDEDSVLFRYYPVSAEVTEDTETGDYYADLSYNADDGTETSTGQVSKIVISVYDENGNPVEGMSSIEVTPPTTRVKLPFAEDGLKSGKYEIRIAAYDREGELLYKPYVVWVEYSAILVPDTGDIFRGLNISKIDYLTTGLIIFGIVAVAGFVFISKNDKRKATATRLGAKAKAKTKSSNRKRK